MSKSFTGGCACGAIRYEVSGDPMMSDCRCRQCQHESGTGHTSNLTFMGATVKVEGKASSWNTVGEGGTAKSSTFCPTCGSPVYMTFPDMPDIFLIRAGSLDDPDQYNPQMVLWTTRSRAWDQIDKALPKFDKMPPRPGAG